MYKGKLTLGDIGVSFLLPEKLLFCTFASSFPTLYVTFILMLMMLFHVDNADENYDEDDDVVPTIASPSRPPSLEFSSSITFCFIMITILITVVMVKIITMIINMRTTSVLSRLCAGWTPLGACFA